MVESLKGVKKIYLVGIGGVGMSGLALLLHDQGFKVLGSDKNYSANTRLLEELGIEVFIGHDQKNLTPDVDLLGYSSAISEDNAEIVEAKSRGVRIVSRGKLLAQLSNSRQTIAIAGSHGKTTTTSLVSYLLRTLGYLPTVFVGGLPLNYTRGAWWGNDYFVIETDESDGSFLHLMPWISILTNIDREHLDYYKSEQNLKESFLKFALQTKQVVFGWADQPALFNIIQKVNGLSFGWGEHNIVRGAHFRFDGVFSFFDLYIKQQYVLSVQVPLLGEHNCLNTLAAFALLHHLGEDLSKANEALKHFRGTKRRFQIKERYKGITFVDDYAHHPTEIRAVIGAAKFLKPRRLFVIVQPHRFSRLKLLQEDFGHCFDGADIVVITDIYSASEKIIEGVSGLSLFQEVKKHFSGTIEYIPRNDLSKELPSYFQEGDVVLALGAGDINLLMEQLIHEFKKHRVIQTG